MSRFNHPSAPNTRPEQTPEQLNRSTTPGGISWKKALALGAVPLALLFGAAFQSSNSVPGQLQAIQAQLSALQQVKPRKFYMTKTQHNGAQALSACAMGFHMASLPEIQETSNLRYDTDLGFTRDDSGFGPPNGFGWIRTGNFANALPLGVGSANCGAWTSANENDKGTGVALFTEWDKPGPIISPWVPGETSCKVAAQVWCVQD